MKIDFDDEEEPEYCEGCGFEVLECVCEPIPLDGIVEDGVDATENEIECLTKTNQLSGDEEIIGAGSEILTKRKKN